MTVCNAVAEGFECPTADIRYRRVRWSGAFRVVVHAPWDSATDKCLKRQDLYEQAKRGGNAAAAVGIVQNLVTDESLDIIEGYAPADALVVSPHPKAGGLNMLPFALAEVLCEVFGYAHDQSIYQANTFKRTKSDRWERLALQPLFAGQVQSGRKYVIVDDVLTLGATLANLRAHIISGGGKPVFATCLAVRGGRSTSIALASETQRRVIMKYGQPLLEWWPREIGHEVACLTEQEAGVLHAEDASFDRVRDRLCEARGCGRAGGGWGGTGEAGAEVPASPS